jgi:hypothetical protein
MPSVCRGAGMYELGGCRQAIPVRLAGAPRFKPSRSACDARQLPHRRRGCSRRCAFAARAASARMCRHDGPKERSLQAIWAWGTGHVGRRAALVQAKAEACWVFGTAGKLQNLTRVTETAYR